jgi:hypothetical protein
MAKPAPMPSDFELQRMFTLAYYLHPERLVALCVTLEACDWIPVVMAKNLRRERSSRIYKLKLPLSSIYRFSVYAASQSWELDQEGAKPRKKVQYEPTYDDFLVRYVKFLIWKAMERPSAYAAVAIGHHIHTYKLNEVAGIAPDHFDEANIRRINSYFSSLLNERFGERSSRISDLSRRVATDHECLVLSRALEVLSPSYSLPDNPADPSQPVLETYFCADSDRSELERVRCILNPCFGGFESLVHEYNSSLRYSSNGRLADPNLNRSIPTFNDKILAGHKTQVKAPSAFERRVEALTATELAAIKHGRKSNA